jgi:hypothetical protein
LEEGGEAQAVQDGTLGLGQGADQQLQALEGCQAARKELRDGAGAVRSSIVVLFIAESFVAACQVNAAHIQHLVIAAIS